MFRLPTNFPGKNLVLLLLVGVLLLAALVADHIFVSYQPIDIVYALPIIAAAFLLSPPEVLATGLIAMVFELTTELEPLAREALWVAPTVGGFGAVVALASLFARQFISKVSETQESLESSPLAYAEFRLPGYAIASHNAAFAKFYTGGKKHPPLFDALPEDVAAPLAELIDRAAATRSRVSAEEFPVIDKEGQRSYWNVNLVPVKARGRSNPVSVNLFAVDVTGAVQRSRTRDAALRISSAVMSSLNLEETIRVAMEGLAYVARTNAGGLFLLKEKHWVGVAGWGDYTDELARQLRWRYEDLPTGVDAVECKQAIAIEDAAADPRFSRENLKRFKIRSTLVIPLVTGNRKIGVAWLIQTDRQKKFSAEQVAFATVIGAQAALAIDNASAYESERTVRKSLGAIESVSEAGLTSLNLNEVLNELVSRAKDALKIDAAMIMLENGYEGCLEALAVAGGANHEKPVLKMKPGQGLAGRAFEEGRLLKIDDIGGREEEMCPDEACRKGSCPFSEKQSIKSVLAAPLKAGGKVIGILQLGSRETSFFPGEQSRLAQVLADRASLAMQNSLQHNLTLIELARVALARDVAAACAGLHDIGDIAKSALKAIHRQLDCQASSIFDFDPDQNALVSVSFQGHPDKVAKRIATIHLDEDTFLARAVKERRIITHETDSSESASQTETFILSELGIEKSSRAAVPIIYQNEIVGGMAIAFPGRKHFSSSEIDTFKSVANQLALVLHNSHAHSRGDHPRPDIGAL